jgi:glucose-1-phosphate adenylyltransferase
MNKPIIGMVLAGGRVDELSVLTAKRPKAALPIWGQYRIIDFALSNMMHAGIEVVGVLAQYRPYSLQGHLGYGEPWDFVGRSRLLRVLSPYKGSVDSDWYKGTADALYQNLDFMARWSPRLVIIVSGDHVCSMDYRPVIREHISSAADLTMAFIRVPPEEAGRYGTAVLGHDGRVLKYREKGEPLSDLASMTVYVFNFEVLVDRLRENAAKGVSRHIYSEIIPQMVDEGSRVFGHVFEGYWRYARSIESYYSVNMEILALSAPGVGRWRLRTRLDSGSIGDPVPALFKEGSSVVNSLVSSDAIIEGTVINSVVSPGVTVGKGALVKNSVLFHRCGIGAGASVDTAVLDKGVRVGGGARVGDADGAGSGAAGGRGVTVIGKNTAVPDGIVIGRNCIIHPDAGQGCFEGGLVPPGTTVKP